MRENSYYDSLVSDDDRRSSRWLADHGYIVIDAENANYFDVTQKMVDLVGGWLEEPDFLDAILHVDTVKVWRLLIDRKLLPLGVPHSVVHHMLATAERLATATMRVTTARMMAVRGRRMV